MKTVSSSTQAADAPALKPEKLAFSIDELCEVVPFGRSFLYEEIRAGRLLAQKAGGRTFVTFDNAKAYLANLPAISSTPDAAA